MGGSWWSIILGRWEWVGKCLVGWKWLEMSGSERNWVGVSGNFFLFFLFFALNSPVKSYSLIHANKKIHINKAKNTIECFLHIFT